MNKEQAEIYVAKSLDTPKVISKGHQYKFLLLNLVCSGIAIALYHKIIFMLLVAFVIMLNIVFTFLFAKRKPIFIKATILIAIQLVIFCIMLNCIIFGLYKITGKLVLWEFLISIVIQLIALGISIVFVIKHANRFKAKEGITKTEITAGVAAGFSYSLALVLCRVFSPSLDTVVSIMATLINLMACLITVGIAGAIYRAYLTKKYGLIIEPDKINHQE